MTAKLLRKIEIHRRRVRREKLKKLREKYKSAQTEEEKKKIIEKMKKITPWLSEEEFLAPIKEELQDQSES